MVFHEGNRSSCIPQKLKLIFLMKKNSHFTLVELMAVIAIIAVAAIIIALAFLL